MEITPFDLLAGFSYELENFVTEPIVITDSYGNPTSTFYYNSNYIFKIKFKENISSQFEYFHDDVTDKDYMTYQLPLQLKVGQATVDNSPYPILGESINPGDPKPIIGYYSIDIDGLIKVHFDDVDKYGNPAMVFDEELQDYVLVNFIDYYTDAEFDLDILAQFRDVGSGQQIDFGNEVIVEVTVENPLAGTLKIAKTSQGLPLLDGKVNFTVTITAEVGPIHGITLSDFLQPGFSPWLKRAIFDSMTVSIEGGTPYTPPEFAALYGELFGDGFNLTFPGVTLDPDETIVVKFTLDIVDLLAEWVEETQLPEAGYNFDIWLYNRATAQGLDEYDEATPIVTADNNYHLYRFFLLKSGEQDHNFDYTARWLGWSVGDTASLINGAVVTDTLTGTVFGANNKMPNDENGVVLLFNDMSGKPIATWYMPVAAGATGFTFTVPIADDMVIAGLQPDGVFVVPEGAHASDVLPYGDIGQVRLVGSFWTTVADTSDFDEHDTVNYQNKISVDINGDHPSHTATASITRPGGTPIITKSGTFGGSGSEIEFIEWTISYYVPRAAYGGPVTFMDDLLMYIYNYDGADPRRLGVQNIPDNFTLKVFSEDLGERELYRDVDFTLLDSGHTNGYFQAASLTTQWFLFFVGDTTGISWSALKENSIWPYQDDTWVTITYQTPLDAIVGEGSNEISLKDALAWAKGDYFSHVQNWIYGYNPIADKDNVATVRWAIRKNGTVSEDIITYKIEIRTEHFELDDLLTDVFDPLLEYVPFSMRIWKKENAGANYGPYEKISDEFKDMLSESIFGNTFSFNFLNMYQINWGENGAEYFEDPTLLSDTAPAYESYVIEFKMKLKDDAPLGQYPVENNVEINGFTADCKTDVGTKIVDKTMSATSNIASVSIIINPDEKMLDGSAGKYTITDIFSDTLAMYLSTIVVEAWESGAWIAHPLENSTSGDIWTYTTTGASQISFVVPDETKLRVTYKALIKGDVGETATISNKVTVAGEYYDYVEEIFYINDTSGSGSGSRTTVTLIKNDSEDPETMLPGAIFALYIGAAYPGWETVKVPSGIDRAITVGTMDFYFLASDTTSDIGRILFDNPWLTPSHMAIYALVEIRAPIGYEMPSDPIYLFSYTAPTEQQKAELGPKQDDVEQISDVISISDDKCEDVSAIIHGIKSVTGDNPPDEIFTFRLTQVADESGTAMPDPYTDTTITHGQGSFGFSLLNLASNNIYYYKITEDVDPTDVEWTFDPNAAIGYIVIVTVDVTGFVTVQYPDEASEVTFVNSYSRIPDSVQIILSACKSAVGAKLPAERFEFGLFDDEDNLIETATNKSIDENF